MLNISNLSTYVYIYFVNRMVLSLNPENGIFEPKAHKGKNVSENLLPCNPVDTPYIVRCYNRSIFRSNGCD